MDHLVYLDVESQELENLQENVKDIIIRGASGRKLPYGRVEKEDVLYFANNNGEGLIKGKAEVKSVFFSEKLALQESEDLYDKYNMRAKLKAKATKRFRGKRYMVIVEIESYVAVDNIPFDKSDYNNMDDWLYVEKIENIFCK
jgi:hypothetical protein